MQVAAYHVACHEISPDTRIERGDIGMVPDCDAALKYVGNGLSVHAKLIILDPCIAGAAIVVGAYG